MRSVVDMSRRNVADDCIDVGRDIRQTSTVGLRRAVSWLQAESSSLATKLTLYFECVLLFADLNSYI